MNFFYILLISKSKNNQKIINLFVIYVRYMCSVHVNATYRSSMFQTEKKLIGFKCQLQLLVATAPLTIFNSNK